MSENVEVKISAETGALTAGLAAASSAVESFKEKSEESFRDLGKEMLGAFGAAALLEGIKSVVEEFSKVSDEAKRLGISTEEVQRLGVVAKAAGADLESLAKSLDKGARNAVEAMNGNAELSASFEKLGIATEEYVNASETDRIVMFAEAIEKTGRTTAIEEAAFKAFGKSAETMFAVAAEGSEALKEKLGSISVASDQTVQDMKEAQESMESFFQNLKVISAEVIDGVVTGMKRVGQVAAVAFAFVSNLGNGFAAAKEAANDAMVAVADMDQEDKKKREDSIKRTKDASHSGEIKEKMKMEEEAARKKEKNDEKAHEMELASYNLAKRKAVLEEELQKAKEKVSKATTNLDMEDARGKRLDIQKELAATDKEIAAQAASEKKKVDEEAARNAEKEAKRIMAQEHEHNEKERKEHIEAQKKVVSEKEKASSIAQKAANRSFSVDDLERIGGGYSRTNYRAGATRDEIMKQHAETAKQQLEVQKQMLATLESQTNTQPQYDGAMSG